MAGPSFASTRKLGQARSREFSIVDSYKLGYRNREDITNLPPGVLIVGSKNVLTNVSERVQIRQGYALDGPTSSVASPVAAAFDWLTRDNNEKHLRAGDLTSAGNDGRLQYRYVDGTGAITWRDLLTTLTSVSYNFTTFWRTDESLRVCLFVNGASQVQEWNGATATLASATSNTLTISGTDSWLDAGFYSVQTGRAVVINGNTYTYTGGESTTTLTGVSPSPAAEPIGSIVHQAVVTTAVSTFTGGPPTTFEPNLIATLNNQVFIAALTQSIIYISQINSYTDYAQSTPRQTGEGGTLILDSQIVGFIPQESYMYVCAGKDLWYNVSFSLQTSTVGVSYEEVSAMLLTNGKQQAAISQAYLSHMKNDVIVVTNETTVDSFGRVEDSLATPQTTNLSDPIKLDIDSYDFTDGCIFYFRYNIYIAVPKEGLVLVYDLISTSWQPPQELPISRFYIVNGELYGHSYNTFESYQLNTGYADRVYPGFTGFPIDAVWSFSYENYGSRFSYKSADALYVEGYINANTMLNVQINYELDGCQTSKTFSLDGSNKQYVCIATPEGSFGKVSLGKDKLGGAGSSSLTGLPPKFRWIPTFNNTDFFECALTFSVLGTDNRAELLAFGLNTSASTQIAVSISE